MKDFVVELPAITAGKSSLVTKPSTVTSTIAVLRLLGQSDQPMGVNAIARQLSLAPSSCFKILKLLQSEEFVDFDKATKAYSLGCGAILLARAALDPLRAYAIARARIEEAAHAMSLTMGLWRVIADGRMLLSGFAEAGTQMRIHMSVGQRLPMLIGAVGRAIAARLNLSDVEMRREFESLRWHDAPSFEEYAGDVRAARQAGYAVDFGRFAPGVTTVAVAVADEVGVPRYGISAIMFSGQLGTPDLEEIGKTLKDIGRWMEVRLFGYLSPA